MRPVYYVNDVTGLHHPILPPQGGKGRYVALASL